LSMADDDVKAKLEAKKKRLEELKKARISRQKPTPAPVKEVSPTQHINVDSLISDIPDSRVANNANSPVANDNKEAAALSPQPNATADTTSNNNVRYRLPKLSKGKVKNVDIQPAEHIEYPKGTQTDESHLQQLIKEKEERLRNEEEERKKKEEELEKKNDAVIEDNKEKEEEEVVLQELSDEQKQQIMSSQDFRSFFDSASRIVEKALSEEIDVGFLYSGEGLVDSGDNADELLRQNRVFEDERWTRNRSVTSFDINTKFPELVLVSYNNNEEAPNEPEGVVLIWNKKFSKTSPEYIFHCQSPVMSACFARFQPHLILGGTYSGQIVAWDMRAGKRTPIQRSPLSASAHTHPVYCLQVVGTQNAHNLISIATDGKLCSWSLDMLSQPQDTLELQQKTKTVAVTTMSFALGEVNSFLVGSEEGTLYSSSRHGNKAGINEAFEGHHGPVTGLDYNKAVGQGDFSHLFISSSTDWTVKLWNNKLSKPLYSFENANDYVFDVKWSPIHPAVFASVDAMGKVDIWNINTDTEVPVVSLQTNTRTALNRMQWSTNGRELHIGDCDGKVYIYELKEKLAVPHNEEWKRLNDTLNEMQQRVTEVPLAV